ncbi:hypothetical protein Trydic_g18002 [Trypoxylus dichotomus]
MMMMEELCYELRIYGIDSGAKKIRGGEALSATALLTAGGGGGSRNGVGNTVMYQVASWLAGTLLFTAVAAQFL